MNKIRATLTRNRFLVNFFSSTSQSTHSSPIHGLPTEVLLDIFDIYIREQPTRPVRYYYLSCVCRLWRDILHNSSALFSVIFLSLRKDNLQAQLDYWLARGHGGDKSSSWSESQKLLSINVDGGGYLDLEAKDRIPHLTAVLRDISSRVGSITLKACPASSVLLLAQEIAISSKLRHLSITKAAEETLPAHIPILFQPPPIPNTELNLHAEFINFVPQLMMDFGKAITHISITTDIGGMSVPIILVFQSCPNLVEFRLDGFQSRTKVMARHSCDLRPSLPRLESICVRHVLDVSRLFGALELSSLRSLELSHFEWDHAIIQSLWDIFLACDDLSALTLNGVCPPTRPNIPTGILPITLPSVTHLSIHGNPVADYLLRLLHLPLIQELELISVSSSVACQFIHSPHLHTLSLQFPPSHTDIHTSTLASLTIDGTAPSFLDHVNVPNLTSLTLLKAGRSAVGYFGAPATPLLRMLHIEHAAVADKDLVQCFRELPLLEELHISCSSVSDDVLHSLATPQLLPDRSTTWLLPHLKYIDLYFNPDVSPKALIQFLTSRNAHSSAPARAAGSDLPRVTAAVQFTGPTDGQNLAALKVRQMFIRLMRIELLIGL